MKTFLDFFPPLVLSNVLSYLDLPSLTNASLVGKIFHKLSLNEKIFRMRKNLSLLIKNQPNTIPLILTNDDEQVLNNFTNQLLKLMIQIDPLCVHIIITSNKTQIKSKVNYSLLKFMIENSNQAVEDIITTKHTVEMIDTFLLEHVLNKNNEAIKSILNCDNELVFKHFNLYRIDQIMTLRPDLNQQLAHHPSRHVQTAYYRYQQKKQKEIRPETNTFSELENDHNRRNCILS
jgi:hypothetical protein